MWHLRDVVLGCWQVHAPTEYILLDPLRWLDAIDSYRVTNTWAPNFAYGLVCDRVEESSQRQWDLSCIRYFLNGGEEREFTDESRIMVPSPKVATYDLQPEMSAEELAGRAVEAILSRNHDLIVLNFANADMVADDIYDDWVKRSFKALGELLPGRYAKYEQVEAYVDIIY